MTKNDCWANTPRWYWFEKFKKLRCRRRANKYRKTIKVEAWIELIDILKTVGIDLEKAFFGIRQGGIKISYKPLLKPATSTVSFIIESSDLDLDFISYTIVNAWNNGRVIGPFNIDHNHMTTRSHNEVNNVYCDPLIVDTPFFIVKKPRLEKWRLVIHYGFQPNK